MYYSRALWASHFQNPKLKPKSDEQNTIWREEKEEKGIKYTTGRNDLKVENKTGEEGES